MKEPIRILQVSAGNIMSGGVEAFVMNLYRHIDRSKIQFDFLTPSKTTFGKYKDEIESLGGNIYELGVYYNKYTRLFQLLYKLPYFFEKSKYKYKIVHVHTGSITTEISMNLIGKLCGIPIRIAHSHSCGNEQGALFKLLQNISKKVLRYCATDYLSCSEKASYRLFSNNLIANNEIRIIKNGIDLKKFSFNLENRKKIRTQFNIENKFVIGHVGCFLPVKNHRFLINIFSNILKQKENACLMLVGEGTDLMQIKQIVRNMHLEDKIIFAGHCENVYEILSAFDVFVMPSLHEGFPVSLIESQANGLPSFISDVITDEIILSPLINKIPLSLSADEWAEEILSKYKPRSLKEGYIFKSLEEYDVRNTAQDLSDFYLNKYKTITDKAI
ncbi:MAG: glycosyltransferase [Candidatus Riflebacteria bacterium]|nr:glycosyltransferase [Candidatus Riflebacteria bacterium]